MLRDVCVVLLYIKINIYRNNVSTRQQNLHLEKMGCFESKQTMATKRTRVGKYLTFISEIRYYSKVYKVSLMFKMLDLYLNNLIIGHKSCNLLSLPNELTLQKEKKKKL